MRKINYGPNAYESRRSKDGPFQCSACGEIKQKIRGKGRLYGKFIKHEWNDELGKTWSGTVCPSCRNKVIQERMHSLGKWHQLDNHPNPNVRKGRDAEHLVKKYCEKLGFTVQLTSLHGPDLIVQKEGVTYTIEVKSTSSRIGRNKTLYVSAVKPNRLNDDLIAIVFPSGKILLEDMSAHLSKCSKNGKRTVSKLENYP